MCPCCSRRNSSSNTSSASAIAAKAAVAAVAVAAVAATVTAAVGVVVMVVMVVVVVIVVVVVGPTRILGRARGTGRILFRWAPRHASRELLLLGILVPRWLKASKCQQLFGIPVRHVAGGLRSVQAV